VSDAAERPRRRYDSPIRREQAAATRDRIITAGAAMAHALPSWNWRDLTVAAVAREAGIDPRTVYRHFATERDLRDAVLARLEEEAGVAVAELTLDRFAEVTARVYVQLDSFAVTPKAATDATFQAVDERRRAALLAAVAPYTQGWSEADRELAAAVLDVMWTVPTYERLRAAWGFDTAEATRAATWMIGVLAAAIRAGPPPSSPP
jgi:AcrR family transcriptional regulator